MTVCISVLKTLTAVKYLPLYSAVLTTPPITATPRPNEAILFKKLDTLADILDLELQHMRCTLLKMHRIMLGYPRMLSPSSD